MPSTCAVSASSEKRTCSCNSRLHLVCNEQHSCRFAQGVCAAHKGLIWGVYSRLTLNGLYQKCRDIGILQRLFQCVQIIVRNDFKPGSIGSKSSGGVVIGAEAYDGRGAAMEISFARDYFGLSSGYSFDVVGPLSGNFDCGFNRFGACIHGKHFVVSEIARHELFILAQVAIEKGAGRQRQLFRLSRHCSHNFGMTMALVYRRISTQEVKVFHPFDVPNANAIAPIEDNRQWMVIVSAVRILKRHGF